MRVIWGCYDLAVGEIAPYSRSWSKILIGLCKKKEKAGKSSSGRDLENPTAFPDPYRNTHSTMVKGIHLIEKEI
jgi:hypothetical protein